MVLASSMPKTTVTIERRFDAPASLVWALLGDSNRFDRAVGLGFASYRWEMIDGRREHVARAKQSGLTMEWIEPPYQWIEGRLLDGTRYFTKGPLGSGGMRVEVEPEGAGSIARVTVWGNSPHWYMWPAKPVVTAQIRRGATRYLDAVTAALRDAARALPPSTPPAEVAALLLETNTDPTARGSSTPTNAVEFDRRAGRLRALGLQGAATERLIAWIRDQPDEDVAQIQPFVRARAWGLDRREVLRTFLHATRAGLVDLAWQINCPVCRVSAAVATSLEGVGRQVHCEACNIRYDVDFARSVEAVFRCNPAVRPVTPSVFCAASPSLRPHVLAQLRIEPGATRRCELPLSTGSLIVRTLGPERSAELEAEVAPASVTVTVAPGRVELEASGRSESGVTALVLCSQLTEPCHVLVERGAWASDAVLGSAIATLPEFMELFATDAPAAGLELSVGRLVLLFSDLTGSTALYERVGDARAFAIVQEHFRVMAELATAHEGTVVKTMGDAVMATFSRLEDATAAALEMVAATESAHGELGVGVKLGIHEGPCLAVRANDRLDFFGTTVNLAARLQAQAQASELVMLRDNADHPAVAGLLAGRPARRFRAALKGIAAEQELVGFALDPGADAASTRERAVGGRT